MTYGTSIINSSDAQSCIFLFSRYFRFLISQAGRSFAAVNSQSQTGGSKKDDKMLDTSTELPELLLAHAKSVRKESDKLIEKVHLLRSAFKNINMDHILEIFASLEGSMDGTESFIEDVETGMHLQLKNCHVAFDVDPHLVDQVRDRKLSQAAFDRCVCVVKLNFSCIF